MSTVDRRQFVAGVAACACAACPALRAFAEATAAGRPAPVDVGPLDEFRAKGIHDPQGAGRRFFLVNRGGRLYAVSATCTHRKVGLVARGGAFRCPRHGSSFTDEGKVTKAPARRSLPRFAIRLTDDGRVVVDPSAAFPPKAWNEPGSYIALR